MAKHNEIGKDGEKVALNYLLQNGFTILHTNWRAKHLEIDIIAEKNSILHFVEVKTRKQNSLLSARESLSYKKRENLAKLVEIYYFLHKDCNQSAQLDLLAIEYKDAQKQREYKIEYYPNYTQE